MYLNTIFWLQHNISPALFLLPHVLVCFLCLKKNSSPFVSQTVMFLFLPIHWSDKCSVNSFTVRCLRKSMLFLTVLKLAMDCQVLCIFYQFCIDVSFTIIMINFFSRYKSCYVCTSHFHCVGLFARVAESFPSCQGEESCKGKYRFDSIIIIFWLHVV